MDDKNQSITPQTKRRTVTFELAANLVPWYTKLPPQVKGFHVNEAIIEGLSHVEPTVDLNLMNAWLHESEARLSSLETDNYLLRQAVVTLHEQVQNLMALWTIQPPTATTDDVCS